MSFDPRSICRALNDAGVRYVIVGGFATVIHGSPLPTADVDVVPRRDADNFQRLARALTALGARLRTSCPAGPGGRPPLGPIGGADRASAASSGETQVDRALPYLESLREERCRSSSPPTG